MKGAKEERVFEVKLSSLTESQFSVEYILSWLQRAHKYADGRCGMLPICAYVVHLSISLLAFFSVDVASST